MTTLEEYRDVWGSPLDTYVLIRVGDSRGRMLIFDPKHRTVEVIEDGEIELMVIDKMIERGFPTLDRFPEGDLG